MKKISKRILAFVIAMTMMLTAIPVSASEVFADIPRKASYMKAAPGDKNAKDEIFFLGTVVGTKKVSVKSSNNKIAVVKKFPMGPGMNGSVIQVYPKKSGTVTITVTANKKSHKCRFTVHNYKNPIASVQVGRYKVAGSKFNKTMSNKSIRYSRLAGKNAKVQVRLKRGWKVEDIMYNMKNPPATQMAPVTIKNGGSLKIRGGAGSSFFVRCYNSKLGLSQVWEIILR